MGRSRWKRTAAVKQVNPVWTLDNGVIVFRDVSIDVGGNCHCYLCHLHQDELVLELLDEDILTSDDNIPIYDDDGNAATTATFKVFTHIC